MTTRKTEIGLRLIPSVTSKPKGRNGLRNIIDTNSDAQHLPHKLIHTQDLNTRLAHPTPVLYPLIPQHTTCDIKHPSPPHQPKPPHIPCALTGYNTDFNVCTTVPFPHSPEQTEKPSYLPQSIFPKEWSLPMLKPLTDAPLRTSQNLALGWRRIASLSISIAAPITDYPSHAALGESHPKVKHPLRELINVASGFGRVYAVLASRWADKQCCWPESRLLPQEQISRGYGISLAQHLKHNRKEKGEIPLQRRSTGRGCR